MTQPSSVQISLRGGMHFEGLTSAGPEYAIHLDAEPEHGGQEMGSRPLDLMLVSLAGCTGMDVISILRKKQQAVTGLDIHVHGERADDHPKVFTHIRIRYVVTGRGVQPEAVARAIELSITRYCPAAGLLRQVVPIETDYEVLEG